MRRTFALFLCIAMFLSLFPLGAFAEEELSVSVDRITEDIPELSEEDALPEESAETLTDTPEELPNVEILTEVIGDSFKSAGVASNEFSEDEEYIYVDASANVLSSGGFLPRRRFLLTANAYNKSGAIESLVAGMKNYTTEIDVRQFRIPVSDVLTVFTETLNSHPELYYVCNTFNYGYSPTGNYVTRYILTYDANYSHTEQAYEAAIRKALACVKDGMTDLQKALVLHDYLAEHIDYDYSLSRFNSYDALVTGSCVCQGYALAYFELLRHCGIGCEVVTSDTMQHAWNAVMLDNDWYHTDITWDDQSNSAKQGVPGKAMHTHFLASDQRMGGTLNHNNWVSSHPCQSTTYDAGGFWTESKSQIVMPDAQSAYYLLGTKSSSSYGYTVTLYCRDMLTGISEALLTLDTIWKSGGSGYWQGTYSFLSYDKGLLWLNDADRVYTYSPADGQSKTVYTAPEGSQIYGFFQEAGAAVIALSNTPNSFSSVISTTITPTVRYLVTYDANGGEGVIAAQFKTAGEDLTLSLEVPTRNGYSFVGWAVDRGSREVIYRSGGSYTIDADITLYAVWKVPGDVNGDGYVGTKDFITLMRYYAGDKTMLFDPNALDIDGSGTVEAFDYITLMQYLAGMNVVIH